MLQAVTRLAITAPRRIITIAVLLLVGAAIFGIPVIDKLSGGGFQDPGSQSSKAADLLRTKFAQTDQKMLITVASPAGVGSNQSRQVGTDIVDGLQRSPWVLDVSSPWTMPPGAPPQAAAQLISKDGKSGLIVAGLKGGENDAQIYASKLSRQLVHDRDGVTVRAGGTAMAYAEINDQNERDLVLMEGIAIPLSFAVLVWVLGGLVAAALPIVFGTLAIVGTMSVLRLISFTTDVSTYALDLSIAMGLALAIDYNLLIISRYREELAQAGCDRNRALMRTMATAGRTVLFSATTVALSMAVMALFPMYFLKSSAYTMVAAAIIVAMSAVVVTPAAIALLGPRVDAFDIRPFVRRLLPRARLGDYAEVPTESLFWYRSTKFVLRHAVPIGGSVVALLLLLGVPFLGVKWGFPDERVLPKSASARQVADALDNDFPASGLSTAVSVVVPDARGVTPAHLNRYATDLSRVLDVSAVTAPTGTFVDGHLVGPPVAATGFAHDSAFFTVETNAPLYSKASDTQLNELQKVPGPAGRSVELGGFAEINRDSIAAISQRLPEVLGLIALITFTLLFLLTGSVVLPVQALVCNLLSLTAAFGAMVWIFQDGHLRAFGTTPNGTLNANIPVLLFCIAFGLAMDYEVFLVSRIREYWLASQADRRTRPDPADARAANDESTALGIAGIGRVVTTAALVMSISFAALIPAHVSFMRMLGLGLTLAVLVDATLVRMVLVPAFLHLLGRWTWWAPMPLLWLHDRSHTGEGATVRVGRRRWDTHNARGQRHDRWVPTHGPHQYSHGPNVF